MQLITDILDLSKIEAGTFEFSCGDVDVNLLCEDIVCCMQMKVHEEVELLFDSHLPQCHIISDRNRLHQVILNFVNNAIKFTSQGSIRVGYQVKGEDWKSMYRIQEWELMKNSSCISLNVSSSSTLLCLARDWDFLSAKVL